MVPCNEPPQWVQGLSRCYDNHNVNITEDTIVIGKNITSITILPNPIVEVCPVERCVLVKGVCW